MFKACLLHICSIKITILAPLQCDCEKFSSISLMTVVFVLFIVHAISIGCFITFYFWYPSKAGKTTFLAVIACSHCATIIAEVRKGYAKRFLH